MTLVRFFLLILCALIPLALLREVWWGPLLFERPWNAAGGGRQDFGALRPLLEGPMAGLMTLVAGLVIALVMDFMTGWLRGAVLPLSLALATGVAAVIIGVQSSLSWAAFWPMWGFGLVSLVWIYAVLRAR